MRIKERNQEDATQRKKEIEFLEARKAHLQKFVDDYKK